MIVLLNFNTFKIDDAQKRQIRKRAFLPFSYGCAQAGYGPYQHYIKTSINNIAGLKSSQLLMPCHLLYLLQPSLLYNSTFVIVYELRLTNLCSTKGVGKVEGLTICTSKWNVIWFPSMSEINSISDFGFFFDVQIISALWQCV